MPDVPWEALRTLYDRMGLWVAVWSILPFVAVVGVVSSHALGPQSLNGDSSWGEYHTIPVCTFGGRAKQELFLT